jgi:hypothetical protein
MYVYQDQSCNIEKSLWGESGQLGAARAITQDSDRDNLRYSSTS